MRQAAIDVYHSAQKPALARGAPLSSLLPIFLLFLSTLPAAATPDTAAGEAYLEWIMPLVEKGELVKAEAALVKAADFASADGAVSSDIWYLLANVRRRLGRPVREVLDGALRAEAAERWSRWAASDALLLKAWAFVGQKRFTDSLDALDAFERAGRRRDESEAAEAALLRLRCYDGLGWARDFLSFAETSLDRFSGDARFVSLIFERASRLSSFDGADGFPAASPASEGEREILRLALSRVPRLREAYPELAPLSAPFIFDREEAAALLRWYRSFTAPSAASLTVSVELGVLGAEAAVEELFTHHTLDLAVLRSMPRLLDTEASKRGFQRGLSSFTGTIFEDADGDHSPEAFIEYQNGLVKEYRFDDNSEKSFTMSFLFADDMPVTGEVSSDETAFKVVWDPYPALSEVISGSDKYIFPPASLFFQPLHLTRLASSLTVPRRDSAAAPLTERALYTHAAAVERPSARFTGAQERVELRDGVPLRAEERGMDGKLLSETVYSQGKPVRRRLDLDMDGRFETIQRFSAEAGANGSQGGGGPAPDEGLSASESDFDGDGRPEYRESYDSAGRVRRLWDTNGNPDF